MNIKIEGWKVTIHNENGDRLELKGEFEAGFFKEYENKQLIIADVVGRSEQLLAYTEWLKKEGLLNATISKLIVKKYVGK